MPALLLSIVCLAAEPLTAPAVTITFADLMPNNAAKLADKSDTAPVHKEKIALLLGKRVRIDGFMLPAHKQHVSQFVLSSDIMRTNFPPGEMVLVMLRANQEVTYTLKSITVEATLSATTAELTKIGVYYQLSDAEVSGPNAEVRQVKDEMTTND